jgi:hypothetical protein
MRRNFTFGSASSRPSLQRRRSNHKSSITPMLLPAYRSKSIGTFWILLTSATTLLSRSIKKNTLLGQFGKSKWQSYYELLRLHMEMQGLKPSVLMGKLKQHLPPGVSPDNDLFLSMFLIRPSAFHERSGESWDPRDGCSHSEGCRRPVECSGRPRPNSCGCLNTAQ